MRDYESTGAASFADYGNVLWRRRLTVLAAAIGVPLVAIALSYLQSTQYRASADVLLRTENLAATLSGVPDPNLGQDPKRLLDTQAKLARTPPVALAAINSKGVRMTPQEFLAHSDVSADPGADILTFSTDAERPSPAVRRANAYASAYARYRTALDVGPVRQALATVDARIARLRDSGGVRTELYASLLDRQQQLESIRDLRSQSAVVVDPAVDAVKITPRPRFAAMFGLVAGALLGIAVALVREAVEKRPRSAEELQRRLGLRVLGRIPATPEGATSLVTISHPNSIDAEAYRLLRMNFEHAADDGAGGVFTLTSGLEGEGKSTVAANLAVALARAGRDVILVDGDPLRPVVGERFGIKGRPGLMEVASGRASLDEALVRFTLPVIPGDTAIAGSSSVMPVGGTPVELRQWARGPRHPAPSDSGNLRVLVSNPTPVELSDYLVATKVGEVVARLRSEAEIVIVDTAPLTTSIGMGVAGLADGVVVVVNLERMRRPVLNQMVSVLDELATPKIGLVFTGLALDATLTYGYHPTADGEVGKALLLAPAQAENRWSSAL